MSDLGPQFVSDLMKEICRLLSIQQLTSTRYHPMCNGLVTAGAQFTKMMRKALNGIPHVVNYIDDILIHTNTWDEHMEALGAVLSRLREVNLAARPSKCAVGFCSI